MNNDVDDFCSNCGIKLDQNAKFCQKCGEPAHDGVNTSGNNPAQPALNHPKAPKFRYSNPKHHSKIITRTKQGVPVVKFQDLHPNAVILFFSSFVGKTAILIPLFAMTVFVEPLVAAILIVSYILILYLVAKMFYKNYMFEITEFGFRKEYGIMHKKSVNIPFEQIQNVNIRRSVVDQMLDLAHVDIETAGESGANGKTNNSIAGLYGPAEGYIPGVSPEEAIDLRDLLLARVQDAG